MTLADHTTQSGQTEMASEPMLRAEPMLFLVMELHNLHAPAASWRLAGVRALQFSRGNRRETIPHGKAPQLDLAIAVPDISISRKQHARILMNGNHWYIEDQGSKLGTIVNGTKLGSRQLLRDGDLIEIGYTFFIFRDSVLVSSDDVRAAEAMDSTENAETSATSESERGFVKLLQPASNLATIRPDLHRDFLNLARVAEAQPSVADKTLNVMLTGETGTGKEVTARAIHKLSRRSGGFIGVNCGAFPPNLLESELFGFKKGAFSGAASDSDGWIRAADRGTLFLDEIGDLPMTAQAAFLRVLQEREVTPIGSRKAIPVDVRLVCATHRNLDEMVSQGKFRSDLHGRLAGFRLTLPPLRNRREDLGLLIGALIRKHSEQAKGVTIAVDAARALLRYNFPENVRELETSLTTALVLAGDKPITSRHLQDRMQAPPTEKPGELPAGDAQQAAELRTLLQKHRGNVTAIARELGTDPSVVHRRLRKFGINQAQYRPK